MSGRDPRLERVLERGRRSTEAHGRAAPVSRDDDLDARFLQHHARLSPWMDGTTVEHEEAQRFALRLGRMIDRTWFCIARNTETGRREAVFGMAFKPKAA